MVDDWSTQVVVGPVCVSGVAGGEGGRAAPPRSQPGAVAALLVFSGAAAIAGLRRGIQCGMGRSWGGHGLSRNTDCPSIYPPA